ncbi:hypothetical protein Pfo_025116 [Paulownia fortunei]|nr:hypothetical protein Pfo_025116 [Paulownia fortunei]
MKTTRTFEWYLQNPPPGFKPLPRPKIDYETQEAADSINGIQIIEHAAAEWYIRKPPPGSKPLARPKIDQEIQEAVDSINGVQIADHVVDSMFPRITTRNLVLKPLALSKIDDEIQARIVDIDADVKDPLMCPDIAKELFQNLRLNEVEKRPRTDYMEKVQKHINPRTRAHCVDWLVYAAEQLGYVRETLHLAVNYLDRYLSGNQVDQNQLRFLGLTCMMIASKYEEVREPHFDFDGYFCLTKSMFSRKEFIQMEHSILSYLKYDVTIPTTWSFLERFVRAAQGGREARLESLDCMAGYLAELSLLSYCMLRFLPSLVAASSVFLAQYILFPSKRPWNATLQHYTLYQPSDLHECVMALHGFCYNSSGSNMPTIRMKYSQQRYECVALKSFPPSIPPEYFQNLSC